MKKLLALVLALAMAFALVACGSEAAAPAADGANAPAASAVNDGADAADAAENNTNDGETAAPVEAPAASDIKIGIVLVGDENEGYTYAHIKGIQDAMATLGLTDENVTFKYSVPEDENCYDACADFADAGCQLVITNSYGHQTYAQQAAIDYPNVTFVACTGDTAKASGLANFKNAFTGVYESRYVSGVVAGMKVAELVAADALSAENYTADGKVKIGYVGAYPYAEVVSGYTAFFLGIKSVYDNVDMEVTYTNSWFDITAEGTAAESLMADGCVIIGQHADSTGAPAAVQAASENGTLAFSVGYNIDMLSAAPTAALTSATNNWGAYYTYAFGCLVNGQEIDTNWCEGYNGDAVAITALGPNVAEGTAEKVAEVEAAIMDGSLHVFDTSTFTVGGAEVTSAFATDTDGDFVPDTDEAVFDGYYHESFFQSAPSFSLRIDGITELN